MKSLFAQFRISNALDSDQPVSYSLRRQIDICGDLQRFEAAAARLDLALTGGPARPSAPASLHVSIMRAVKAVAQPGESRSSPVAWRWLPAPALALILVAGLWYFLHRESSSPQLEPAAAVLELGQTAAHTIPVSVVAPLSDEWQRLNRDLDQTARFLLASLP